MNQEDLVKNRQVALSIMDDLGDEEDAKQKRLNRKRAILARREKERKEKWERDRPEREFAELQNKVKADK